MTLTLMMTLMMKLMRMMLMMMTLLMFQPIPYWLYKLHSLNISCTCLCDVKMCYVMMMTLMMTMLMMMMMTLTLLFQPIPYWLYKLHGLNISYTCEICGNFTYRGPKTFQRHFAESRHAHGMRCLGIPNTAHFANVTSIEDAMACE